MRRFTRFSLRTLLIVTTILCCLLAVQLAIQHSAARQRKAVAAIDAAGGSAIYDYEIAAGYGEILESFDRWHWDEIGKPAFPPKPWAPAWFVDRLGVDYFCTVRAVLLRGGISPFQDATPEMSAAAEAKNAALAPHLAQLDQVETVVLNDHLPPETLASLAEIPRLRRVYAHESIDKRHAAHIARSAAIDVELCGSVDDAQLAALAQSTRLERLTMSLQYTGEPATFTDLGVESLSHMRQLTSLSLKSDHVTPAAAPSLARMKQLRELHLWLPRLSSSLPDVLTGKPLQSLTLAHMPLDEATWQAIGQLQQLDTLCIHRPAPLGAPPSLDNSEGLSQTDLVIMNWDRPTAARLPATALHSLCKLKFLRRLRLDFELTADEIRTLLTQTPIEFLVLGSDIAEVDGRALIAEFPHVRLRYETSGINQFCSGTYSDE